MGAAISISFAYDRTYPGPAFPIIELQIASEDTTRAQTVVGLVDSGADATLVPVAVLDAANIRKIDGGWARTVSGERYPVSIFLATITIGPHVLRGIELLGNDKTDEGIVGRDVLNQLIITLNGLAQVVDVTD